MKHSSSGQDEDDDKTWPSDTLKATEVLALGLGLNFCESDSHSVQF